MTITEQSPIELLESFIPSHPNILAQDRPSWIKDVSYREQILPDSSQKELQFLLFDRQYNIEAEETYLHTVQKVLPGGVEKASLLSINFDPLYESIIVHRLAIYRDEKLINTLLSGNARILQRELGLEQCIYDGSLSLTIIFSNVKIGDIIHLSYTKKGRNPVYSSKFEKIENFTFREKVEKYSFRCVRNKDRVIYFKTFNASSTLLEQPIDNSCVETSYVAEPCNVLENYNIPNWYMCHELIQLSDFESWQEVSTWGKNLFCSDQKNEIAEIKTLISKWKEEGKGTKALVASALDFVQNEIRYLGIEEGIHSHQPHPANETLSNRYGDCKDKTVLLKVFMDEIGLVSTPTLVSTIYRNQIVNFLPSSIIFNHAILYVKINDEFYWLDPTIRYQGGTLESKSQLFYGSYLLLNGEKECLINHIPQSNSSDIDIESHYIFSPNQCELKIKTVFMQYKADEYRSYIAYQGQEGLTKLHHDFMAQKFGSVDIKETISVVDDLELNQITITENYIIKDLYPLKKFSMPLYILPEYLPGQVSLSRKEPLFLAYPRNIKESYRISAPSGHYQPANSVNVEHPSFTFNYQILEVDQDIVCKYQYEAKKDSILPEDFGSLRDAISKIHETMFLSYHYELNEDPKDEELKTDYKFINRSITSQKISKTRKFFQNPYIDFSGGLTKFLIIMPVLKLLNLIFRFFS